MLDFSLDKYMVLCESLLDEFTSVLTFRDFLQNQDLNGSMVIIRHDVDKYPQRAERMAQLEYKMGITSTYYFRSIKTVLNSELIRNIDDMGHEIGYHYEVFSQNNGMVSKAVSEFSSNLKMFREIVGITTVCMHGSPQSQINELDIWNHMKLEDYQLTGEPYLSLSECGLHYFTDTGRNWLKDRGNIRDRIIGAQIPDNVNKTDDLISYIRNNEISLAMINIHPQRWTIGYSEWLSELINQSIKNQIKSLLIKFR